MSDPSEAGTAAVAAALDPAASASSPSPVTAVERLRAYKASRAGDDTFKLPETGVTVTVPRFKGYDAWAQAQRLGGRDQSAVMVYFITGLARFDGQKLTFGDYRELIPSSDHLTLLGRLYGDDAASEDDPSGN